jgi:hypothetical protein
MKKQGFDEVVKRVWEPLTTVEKHTHTFHAKALVVQGEMFLNRERPYRASASRKHLRVAR